MILARWRTVAAQVIRRRPAKQRMVNRSAALASYTACWLAILMAIFANAAEPTGNPLSPPESTDATRDDSPPTAPPTPPPMESAATPERAANGDANDTTAAADEAPSTPHGPSVTLITGERIVAALGPVVNGQLTIGAAPPRLVALADIERIELSAREVIAVEWVGQDNSDVAQTSAELGANKIQDIHLRLKNLPTNKEITQLSVICRPQGVLQRLIRPQIHEWRLAQPFASAWRLSLAREESGHAATADIFIEPISTDAFDHEFLVTATYQDQSVDRASVKATSHTNHQLAAGSVASPSVATPATDSAPSGGNSSPMLARVVLDGKDRLTGEVREMDDRWLTLAWSGQADLKIPLLEIQSIRFGSVTAAEADVRFAAALAQIGEEDTVLILGPDGTIAQINGAVQGTSEGKLRFRYDGEVRSINVAKLAGIVFARHPSSRSKTAPMQVAQLTSGDQLSGRLIGITDDIVELETPWRTPVTVARPTVSEIQFRNGRIVYLSDLEPTAVEETPFFGRKLSFRRDQSLTGGRLRIHGQDHHKGLAVHSRSALSFALESDFERFTAIVGFDESAKRIGRVACSVLVDGEVRFHSDSLRADEYPTTISVPVTGGRELKLVVDFGEREDIGDRVIWGSARLLRPAASGN